MSKKIINNNNEKNMVNVFKAIEDSKNALKVLLIFVLNSDDINKYRMDILTTNEVNETLDYLLYILASNSKFAKKIINISISIITNNNNIIKKNDKNNIFKTAIDCNNKLIKSLEKIKDI